MDFQDPLRHHKHYEDSKHGSSPYAGGSSFMERVSEGMASGMGTVGFLLISSGVIIAWVLANHVVHFLSQSWHGLSEQIHTLTEKLNELTEEVHQVTCPHGGMPAPTAEPA